MILSRTTAIPLADYPNGTQSFTLNNLDNAARVFAVEVRRCTSVDPTIWPNESTTLEISVEASTDNGKTFQPLAATTMIGGIWVLRDGTESAVNRLTVGLPEGTRRRLRITVAVAGGPLRTSGTVELRDS